MNVLVVYAHPKAGSFTHRVLQRFLEGLDMAGHRFEVADLYAERFNPVMSAAEYERESKQRLELPLPDDVAREQARLAAADAVAFVFPLWWSDCPAILKGWFDRVYTAGRAYLHREGAQVGLGLRKGIALVTAGHTEELLREQGFLTGMQAALLRDRMANVGVGDPELVLLAGTAGCTDPAHFESLLTRAYDCGAELR